MISHTESLANLHYPHLGKESESGTIKDIKKKCYISQDEKSMQKREGEEG